MYPKAPAGPDRGQRSPNLVRWRLLPKKPSSLQRVETALDQLAGGGEGIRGLKSLGQ